MFDRETIVAVRCSFYERFDQLRERDREVTEAMENYSYVLEGLGLSQDDAETLEEELNCVLAAAGLLSYYIGVQDGAALMGMLKDGSFPENMMAAFKELLPAG